MLSIRMKITEGKKISSPNRHGLKDWTRKLLPGLLPGIVIGGLWVAWILYSHEVKDRVTSIALPSDPAIESNHAERINLVGKTQSRRYFQMIPLPARVPAETEKLSAVLLAPSYFLANDEALLLRVTHAIADKVPVVYIVQTEHEMLRATEILDEHPDLDARVSVMLLPISYSWIRDYGGLFVRCTDGSPMLVDFRYYESRPAEDRFPVFLSQLLKIPYYFVPLKLEGGNLLSNGAGVCVTTNALIRDQVEYGIGADEIAQMLNYYMAFKNWVLPQVLPMEKTRHVDTYMTFTSKLDVIVGKADPGMDADVAQVLDEAAELLGRQQSDERAIRVHRIPMPPKKHNLYRSYTNVLYVNGRILVPSFSDVDPAVQEEAYALYRVLLPEWEVVPIACDELTELGGFLHCMTLGIPHWVDPTNLLEFGLETH